MTKGGLKPGGSFTAWMVVCADCIEDGRKGVPHVLGVERTIKEAKNFWHKTQGVPRKVRVTFL